MEYKDMSPRHYELLKRITSLPHRILSLHGRDNVTEFVLHDLCHEGCFNLNKAAYFVDNPDFDCFRGVAGYDRSEDNKHCVHTKWQEPEEFTDQRSQCSFNQKVRDFVKPSQKKAQQEQDALLQEIARELNIENPAFYVWQMKHDNHGILIFQRMNDDMAELDQEVLKGICLLAFCPIY